MLTGTIEERASQKWMSPHRSKMATLSLKMGKIKKSQDTNFVPKGTAILAE